MLYVPIASPRDPQDHHPGGKALGYQFRANVARFELNRPCRTTPYNLLYGRVAEWQSGWDTEMSNSPSLTAAHAPTITAVTVPFSHPCSWHFASVFLLQDGSLLILRTRKPLI